MKTVALDASVVLGYLLESNKYAVKKLPTLLRQADKKQIKIISLPLLSIEIANGLRFSLKNPQVAQAILEKFVQLPIKIVDLPMNSMENALQLAYENETTIYDTVYHLLAIARNATLLTCDKQYWRSAKHLNHIELIG